jgi:hypothetical protein
MLNTEELRDSARMLRNPIFYEQNGLEAVIAKEVDDAADEIDRLRAEVAALKTKYEGAVEYYDKRENVRAWEEDHHSSRYQGQD